MTPQQRKLADFMASYQQLHGYPPSITEMGDHLGVASRSSIHRMLTSLEREGEVEKANARDRCWRVRAKDPFAGLEDRLLADELRRRGWNVTATKSITPDAMVVSNRKVRL